jgi:signal transduction histidine kinase
MNNQRELIIFRIVQEAFNNIIKHAKASRATLSLQYNRCDLLVNIEDDGQGFETTEIHVKRNAGLKNIETRIKMLRGMMKITSIKGTGTSLSFTIPLE